MKIKLKCGWMWRHLRRFLKILIKEFYFDIIEGVNNYSVGNKMDLNGYRLILLNKNSL